VYAYGVTSAPAKLSILSVLAFQLAFGFQLQPAVASAQARGVAAFGTAHTGHCSTNTGARDSGPVHSSAAHPGSVSSAGHPGIVNQHHSSPGDHECCRSLGCQCQCACTPAAFDFPVSTSATRSPGIIIFPDAQILTVRVDELFRPPIA